MAAPVRVVGHDSTRDNNEGYVAQVDRLGNLMVREGPYPGLNKTYEDTSFVEGETPVTHNFFGDMGKYAIDGYIICDGPGDIQVDFTRNGVDYGSKFTMKVGERVSLLRLDIKKIRITWVSDSAYRVNLI